MTKKFSLVQYGEVFMLAGKLYVGISPIHLDPSQPPSAANTFNAVILKTGTPVYVPPTYDIYLSFSLEVGKAWSDTGHEI